MSSDQSRHSEFVQSLERGLAVIRAFSAEEPTLTLSDVAERTGLTRAAARRFLLTLQDLGYVGSNGRDFFLRPRLLELGYAYLSSLNLWEIAQPYMQAVSERLHESCSAAVLDGHEIVYVARVAAKRIMTIALLVGSRLPAHATSMGRVLLAALPPAELDRFLASGPLERLTERTVGDPEQLREILASVRTQGWALVDQELEEGVRSVAVPLCDARGATIAAMNVSAHAGRVSLVTLRDEFLPVLRSVGERISEEFARRRLAYPVPGADGASARTLRPLARAAEMREPRSAGD